MPFRGWWAVGRSWRQGELRNLRQWPISSLSRVEGRLVMPRLLTLLALTVAIGAVSAIGAYGGASGMGQRLPEGSAAASGSLLERPVERLRVEVLDAFPHDRGAFTQGLLWHAGNLLESTGQYGDSTIRRVAPDSGDVLDQQELDDSLFGEGLARVDDRLIQLTWKAGRALIWSIDGLERVGEFTYSGDGWGLCHDGTTLFMSDGSARLILRDPQSFVSRGELLVSIEGRSVAGLNELECAEGWIYANVYGTRQIVRIDPSTGHVAAVIDAGALPQTAESGVDVLNGIAYRQDRGTFLLTGKYWPKLFEVTFVPAGQQ